MVKANKVLAVLDPTRLEQPALEKAERVASLDGAALHLYCCVPALPSERDQDELLEQTQRWMERLANTSRGQGIETTIEVDASVDWRDAIVVAADRNGADLVVKATHRQRRLRRSLMKTADWVLLRDCPCAMLLVKSGRPWSSGKILAAVKVEPGDATHTVLNDWVVRVAHHVARDVGGELHAVTAHRGEGLWFDRQALAERCGLPRSRIHGGEGPPSRVISRLVKELPADILVIGTVAQREAQALVGHTAEKLVDDIDTDIVALPPRIRRRRVAEKLARAHG